MFQLTLHLSRNSRALAGVAAHMCFRCAFVLCFLFLTPVTTTVTTTAAGGTVTGEENAVSKNPLVSLESTKTADTATATGFVVKSFKNVTKLTFSHCDWGWTVESLLLFAYRLAAAKQEALGYTTTTSSSSRISHSHKSTSLCNLQQMIVIGADLFDPPPGCMRITEADTRKIRRTCALFHAICSVQLIIDGVTCRELEQEGKG